METKCEIDGCRDVAQSKLTTSGYELCAAHYEQWSSSDTYIAEENGKVVLKEASTDL